MTTIVSTSQRLRSVDQIQDQAPSGPARLGEFGCLVGGREIHTGEINEVRSPFDRSLVALVHRAGPQEIERAIADADAAFRVTRALPSWKRAEILEAASTGIAARREDLAQTIALEAGKPIKTARIEVDRAAFTFKIAAEETKRIVGEIVALDWLPGLEGREAYVRRVPLGPVAGITPFNFPLNLVSHKVAPALASGDPIIVRPATQTPVSALKLGRILVEAGWPREAVAVVPSSTNDATPLVEDERIKLLSFTGSPAVGWDLKRRAGRKRITLELGGNAAVIVHHDADVAYAAERIVWGGFAYSGQTCISVQRVYAHETVYDSLVKEVLERVRRLKTGDPLSEDTDLGPLIDGVAAARVQEWLDEAIKAGAVVLTGGARNGWVWEPTVVASLPSTVRMSCQEVFAPVVSIDKYSDIAKAIRSVNDSEYGLQAGIFTHDDRVIAAASDDIDVGGLMVNDVSMFRVDHMPYGGVKLSGFGREGVRYAIEEMTERKLVTVNRRR